MGWRGRIFTLTFKEQTQCSVGWHICLLFHSKIKLLSMRKFKSSRVAAVSRRFVLLLFPFLFIFFSSSSLSLRQAAQCPRFASSGGPHNVRQEKRVCFWGGTTLVFGETSVQLRRWPWATWSGLIERGSLWESRALLSYGRWGPLLSDAPAQ